MYLYFLGVYVYMFLLDDAVYVRDNVGKQVRNRPLGYLCATRLSSSPPNARTVHPSNWSHTHLELSRRGYRGYPVH